MSNKSLWLVIVSVFIVGIGAYFYWQYQKEQSKGTISTFQECLDAGYPVAESYPRQCMVPGGKSFTELLTPDPSLPPITITESGEITCLPKVGDGAQTMECAIGFKAEDNKYYALKNLSELDPDYKFSEGGLKVDVVGILKEEEMKGPDGNNYDIEGVIELTSIEEAL